MDISKWAFKNRNLVYFLVTVLFVGGILSCYQMSKLEDPEIKVKLAMVVTTYPGASAHQVELEVTDVLSQISAKYGKTPAQGAIAWLLQTPGITAPIVGAKNGRQAQENLKAAGWQFSKEDYDVIDRASRRFMEGLPHYTLFFNTETTN